MMRSNMLEMAVHIFGWCLVEHKLPVFSGRRTYLGCGSQHLFVWQAHCVALAFSGDLCLDFGVCRGTHFGYSHDIVI